VAYLEGQGAFVVGPVVDGGVDRTDVAGPGLPGAGRALSNVGAATVQVLKLCTSESPFRSH
jgi:hypothetical protein